LRTPPPTRNPLPKAIDGTLAAGAVALLLPVIRFAVNTASRCGGTSSISSDAGTIPTRLLRQIELTTYMSPPELVPE
jgi:hypothetical protein